MVVVKYRARSVFGGPRQAQPREGETSGYENILHCEGGGQRAAAGPPSLHRGPWEVQ